MLRGKVEDTTNTIPLSGGMARKNSIMAGMPPA
jgi:hypothetical protein